MAGQVQAVPEGFHTVTPHIILKDAAAGIEFYQKAFGAREMCRMPGPDGKSIMHAEIQIGNSRIMMASECPEFGVLAPETVGGSPVTLHLYVDDVDAAMKKAEGAGCVVTMPAMDMFWGDRYGKLKDPHGHHWSIATHTADLTPEQIAEGAAKAMSEGGS